MPTLTPGGGERYRLWGRQEAPQGSPTAVTAQALKEAGSADTHPSSRPQSLAAPRVLTQTLTPQDIPLEAPVSPPNFSHQAFSPGHPALSELQVLPSGG